MHVSILLEILLTALGFYGIPLGTKLWIFKKLKKFLHSKLLDFITELKVLSFWVKIKNKIIFTFLRIQINLEPLLSNFFFKGWKNCLSRSFSIFKVKFFLIQLKEFGSNKIDARSLSHAVTQILWKNICSSPFETIFLHFLKFNYWTRPNCALEKCPLIVKLNFFFGLL